MPSPIDILLDPISLIILAMYGGVIAWEALFPARQLPHIPWWRTRGLCFFALYFFLTAYFPLFVDPLLTPYQLFDLSSFGTLGGAAIAILLFEFGIYLWHRAIHSHVILWRVFHQLHHSAERVDAYGTFFFSPMDILGFSLVASLSIALLIGIEPQAVTVFLLVTTFLPLFQHANIRTPQWLGYVIQRPESHCVHHAKNIHSKNFSDLPVFDILFGTFANPKVREHEAGYYEGASARVVEMLAFQDVSQAPEHLSKRD